MGTLRSDSFTDRAFPHSLLGHEIVWVDNKLGHALLVAQCHSFIYSLFTDNPAILRYSLSY